MWKSQVVLDVPIKTTKTFLLCEDCRCVEFILSKHNIVFKFVLILDIKILLSS